MVKYDKNNQTLPRNGQNWSKYAKNSQKLSKIIKHLQTFAKCEYCQNQNVRKWSKMHQFGKIVKYCQNIGNICQNVRRLSKIVKNW